VLLKKKRKSAIASPYSQNIGSYGKNRKDVFCYQKKDHLCFDFPQKTNRIKCTEKYEDSIGDMPVKLSIRAIYNNPDIILKYIDDLLNLPTIPLIVKKINEVVKDPSSSAKDLEKIILQDQSLTAKVLSLSNSAYYSFGREIKSVWQAIVLLGFESVKNIAISLSIIQMFKDTEWIKEMNPQNFWIHSFSVAVGADFLGDRSPETTRQLSYLSGLLHDLGKVVFLQALGGEYLEVINYAQNIGCTITEAEDNIMGINHAKVGGYLSEKWALPSEVKATVYYHHSPNMATEYTNFPIIVSLADKLTKQLKIGFSGDFEIDRISEAAIHKLRLTSIDILECKEYLKKERAQIETLSKVIY